MAKPRSRARSGVAIVALATLGVAACGSSSDHQKSPPAASITPRDGSIEAAITNIEYDEPTTYSGAKYHPDTKHFTIYGTQASMDDLKAYFRKNVTSDADYNSIDFEVVQRSLAELHAIQAEIGQARDWFTEHGIEPQRDAVREDLGKVEITLVDYSPEAARKILDHFGADRVTVNSKSEGRLVTQ